MVKKDEDIIAFWGYPKKSLISEAKREYPCAEFVDLDIDFKYPDLKIAPDNYCRIIKNILNNAFYLKNRIIKILAPIGKDKCDSGFFVSEILKKEGFCVVQSVFEDKCPDILNVKIPISRSNLPLKEKIELITKNIIEEKDYSYLKPQKARFGFWGVPPNDFKILELFDNTTEVFGWLRAVEAGYPGDFELENYIDKNIRVVFFAQAFCSKTILAKRLADKYGGLFIDMDTEATKSTMAKIEAFLKLG